MWRTVIVNQGERISVEDGNIKVAGGQGKSLVPLADIYAVVIDNRAAFISVQALALLAESGAHVYYCNEKHLPVAVTLPLNRHFRPLSVLKRQFALSEELKGELWRHIVRRKIQNQAKCLSLVGIKRDKVDELLQLADQVECEDKSGMEAQAARKYFSALFGLSFLRRQDSVTNMALNYGYAIFRTSLCKTLVGYGFQCILGIHHRSESNEFNLADDLIEPFRPLVDLWTDENCENLFETLNKSNRKGLINLLNVPMKMGKRKMRTRNAMDECVCSLVTAIEKGNPDLLKLPELIALDELFEEE